MDRYEKALQLLEEAGNLIAAFTTNTALLTSHVRRVQGQIATAKKHGLGPALMAPDLLKGLVPDLKCIEALAKRAIEQIEEVQE